MKVLIVGAAGFVGGYLIEELKSVGAEIVATKLPFERIDIGGVAVRDLDITDQSSIDCVLSETDPDVVFHLAAQSSVKLSWEKPAFTANVNIIGAINLFESAKTHLKKSARILVVGSGEEYGEINYSAPVKETTEPKPKNIYALTKLAQENIAKIYVGAYGLNIVMTRSFNHIGPKQSPQFVVADFCSQVAKIEKGLSGNEIAVGNLSAKRDFTDVRDVVKAYVLLAEKGESGETYNVGSGVSVAVSEILDRILRLSEKDIKVVVDGKKLRPVDVPEIRADISKISALGWERTYDLNTTLRETLDYFRKETL